MMRKLRDLLGDCKGLSSIEYALIASLISVAAIAGYDSVGDKVEGGFTNTQAAIASNT